MPNGKMPQHSEAAPVGSLKVDSTMFIPHCMGTIRGNPTKEL